MPPLPALPAAYKVLDLFAGAGGFSLGFQMAGFVPVAAVEIDEWACATLRHNYPAKIVARLDLSAPTQVITLPGTVGAAISAADPAGATPGVASANPMPPAQAGPM